LTRGIHRVFRRRDANLKSAGNKPAGTGKVEETTAENKESRPEDTAATVEEQQPDQVVQLVAERDGLKKERDELREIILRRQAEFDNFRKRTEKERSEYVQYAGAEIVRDLLHVIDDFERALKNTGASPEYAKGVEMIYGRLYDALKKSGLEPLETEGKMFDPYLHQAVERVESKDAADGTILAEFQRGYNFKGKLLRPSMVKVAVHS